MLPEEGVTASVYAPRNYSDQALPRSLLEGFRFGSEQNRVPMASGSTDYHDAGAPREDQW